MSVLGIDGEFNPDPGAVSSGCFIGCLIQISLFFCALALSTVLSEILPGKAADRIVAVVIMAAWITLVPLIRKKARQGQVFTRDGLILSAAFGALLGTTCGSYMLSL